MRARALIRAGLATAVVDFVFASALSIFAYGSTFARLWQGVASVLIGPEAFDSGAATIALGIAMHVLVAFTWAAVFLFLLDRVSPLRQLLRSPAGPLTIAAVYGPLIWVVMSFVVIPAMTGGGLPSLTARWWIQAVGHVFAVALPMASVARHDLRTAR